MDAMRCFKLCHGEWHPSYNLLHYHNGVFQPKLVEVSYLPLTDGKFRVCVWGADDFGLERDYVDSSDAFVMYLKLLRENHITVAFLRDNGFVNA